MVIIEDKRTDNIMVIIKITKGQTIPRSYYYDHGIVCHFVLSIMTMVLSVLISFLL
jgi:hypothetical protein